VPGALLELGDQHGEAAEQLLPLLLAEHRDQLDERALEDARARRERGPAMISGPWALPSPAS
jgi:hypothetical protein